MVAANHSTLYLYDTHLGLVISDDNIIVDNRPMYQRTVIAHRGLTNAIYFNVTNRDRRPQDVSEAVASAVIFDPKERKRLLAKLMEPTDTEGRLKLTLAEGDLQNIKPGRYHMYVAYTTNGLDQLPFYSNQDNGVRFDIEITQQAMLSPLPTQEQTELTEVDSDKWVTSAFSGNQARNFDGALHSIAIYMDEYVGRLVIQGSCNEEPPSSAAAGPGWFDVHSEEVYNAETGIFYLTFSVNANWIRVLDERAFGSIVKVQLRN